MSQAPETVRYVRNVRNGQKRNSIRTQPTDYVFVRACFLLHVLLFV
jgi:hypothetical protein